VRPLGIKNRFFSGQMLYEATKPGSVCPLFCLIVVVERVFFFSRGPFWFGGQY